MILSPRPSRFSACNIEKLGIGPGDEARSLGGWGVSIILRWNLCMCNVVDGCDVQVCVAQSYQHYALCDKFHSLASYTALT